MNHISKMELNELQIIFNPPRLCAAARNNCLQPQQHQGPLRPLRETIKL